jgi:hypothetical protein
MGVFDDYLKKIKNDYITKEGTYVCKLERVVRKNDLENDTIIFVFTTRKRIDGVKVEDVENQEVVLKFNFHNKNNNAISFLIKVIFKIMIAICGSNSEAEKVCLNIMENAEDLDEFKNEIEKLNKKYNKYVEIDIVKKEYNGKTIYAPDYTSNFIRVYNDNNTIDDTTVDDLPF